MTPKTTMPSAKDNIEEVRKYDASPSAGKVVAFRMKPGDSETLTWLREELGMSSGDVLRRALHAYAAQIATIRKK